MVTKQAAAARKIAESVDGVHLGMGAVFSKSMHDVRHSIRYHEFQHTTWTGIATQSAQCRDRNGRMNSSGAGTTPVEIDAYSEIPNSA